MAIIRGGGSGLGELASLCALIALLAMPAVTRDVRSDRLLDTLPERWRCLELTRDGVKPAFRWVRSRGDELLVVDTEGLWSYDGRYWKALLPAEQMRAVQSVHPMGKGWFAPTQRAGGLLLSDSSGNIRQADIPRKDPSETLVLPHVLPDGRLIVGMRQQIFVITPDGLVPYLPSPPGIIMVSGLGHDDQGHIWCTTDAGVFRHDGSQWERIRPTEPLLNEGDLTRIERVQGRLVFLPRVFSRGQSGLVWNGQELRSLAAADAEGMVTDSLVTPDGALVVAVKPRGLLVLDDNHWRTGHLPPWYDEAIVSLAMTSGGRLAAVTRRGRLLLHDLASERWQQFDPTSVDVSPIVNALSASRRGGYWLGTHEGVTRFDGERFQEAFLSAGESGPRLLGITSVLEDDDGQLWVAAGGGFPGVLRWDGNTWFHHKNPDLFGGAAVHRIRRGPDGSIWFLQLSRDENSYLRGGIVVREGQQWRREPADASVRLQRTYDVAMLADGRVIAGLLTGVAVRTDGHWNPAAGAPFGPDGKVFSLHAAADGNTWAGRDLWSPGIALLPAGSRHWSELSGPGWDEAAAGNFAETSDGTLWMASEAGLHLVRGGVCVSVPTEGVVSDPSFWPIEADADDSLWIGSMGNGLLHLKPDDHKGPTSQLVAVRTADDSDPQHLEVTWRTTDAWEASPRSVLRWRTRIDSGPWSAWATPGAPTRLPVERLAPGSYVLFIQGLDAAGNLEEPPLAVPLAVPPAIRPFWLQPPAMAAFGLALISVIALLGLWINRRREQRAEARTRNELNAHLRDLTSRMMSAQEDERRRLSQDLHDDLGQLLTVTCLSLQHGISVQDDKRRQASLVRALASAHRAVESVRQLATRVRPATLDDHGLETAVHGTLDEFAESTGLAVERDLSLARQPVPRPAADHVYRILKEALTNVARHAAAKRVDVSLAWSGDRLQLHVRDDGRGFQVPRGTQPSGVGLLGMRERTELLNGTFTLNSRPGHGTAVSVDIPLVQHREESDP